jgi:hypothetical protein
MRTLPQGEGPKGVVFEDKRIVKHLKVEMGEGTPLAGLTAARISEYKAKLLAIEQSPRGGPLGAASVNRPLALLRCLLNLAAGKWEVLSAVPRIKLERDPEGKVVWLETDAEAALLAGCRASRNPDLYALVLLAVEDAARGDPGARVVADRPEPGCYHAGGPGHEVKAAPRDPDAPGGL